MIYIWDLQKFHPPSSPKGDIRIGEIAEENGNKEDHMYEMTTIHSIKQGGSELLNLEGDAYEWDNTNLQNHKQGKGHKKGEPRGFLWFFSPSSVTNYKHAAYDSGTPQTTDNWRLGKNILRKYHYTLYSSSSSFSCSDRRSDEEAIWIWPDMASLTESEKSWHCCSPCSSTVKCPKPTRKFPTFTNSLTPFREAC